VAALRGCGDDMRALQLQAAELQRRLDATQRAAPDDVSHDRQMARLRAEVLRARREAESLGDALESPEGCAERVRLLPGKLPAPEDLAARAARIEERLAARRDLAAQAGGGGGRRGLGLRRGSPPPVALAAGNAAWRMHPALPHYQHSPPDRNRQRRPTLPRPPPPHTLMHHSRFCTHIPARRRT
jgi:hypothetical protein